VPTSDAIRRIADPRVILLDQTGKGISDARNIVFRQVDADLYMFLDADDFMKPGVVSAYVRHRLETGIAGLRYGHYTRGVLGSAEPEEFRPAPFLGRVSHAFARMCIMSYCVTGAVMLDREVVEATGLFDTRFNHAEDWHYWLRVARRFPVFGLDVVAYRYTYAKLSMARPFPRSFFDDGHKVASELCTPFYLRWISHVCIIAQYAIYYFRTRRGRKCWNEWSDIQLWDILAIPPAAVFYALRRRSIL
jgi:glycosyltransferase involved in cell wall biosynthesis